MEKKTTIELTETELKTLIHNLRPPLGATRNAEYITGNDKRVLDHIVSKSFSAIDRLS